MTPLDQAIDHFDGSTTALAHAINNSPTALAKEITTYPQKVWNWQKRGSKVPAEFAVPIEEATKGLVTRYDLRPDVFTQEQVS